MYLICYSFNVCQKRMEDLWGPEPLTLEISLNKQQAFLKYCPQHTLLNEELKLVQ